MIYGVTCTWPPELVSPGRWIVKYPAPLRIMVLAPPVELYESARPAPVAPPEQERDRMAGVTAGRCASLIKNCECGFSGIPTGVETYDASRIRVERRHAVTGTANRCNLEIAGFVSETVKICIISTDRNSAACVHKNVDVARGISQ